MTMAHYAVIYEQVGESGNVAELLETNPLAASLFLISLARADVYGILPGDPRDYRTRVCPAAALSLDKIQGALSDLERLGMYHLYDACGKKWAYIASYHEYQVVRWGRVGRPDNPLPQCWNTPSALTAELTRGGTGKLPEWFGLDGKSGKPLSEEAWNSSGLKVYGRDKSGSSPGVVRDQSGRTLQTEAEAEATTEAEAEAERLERQRQERLRASAKARPNDADGTGKAKAEPKEDTPHQAVIRSAWKAFGQDTTPSGAGYSGLMKLLQEKGIPLAEAWIAHLVANPPVIPEGAEPWKYFCRQFRDALNRTWEWGHREGAPAASNGGASPTGGSPAAQSIGGPVSRLSPEMRQWRREYAVVDDVPEYKVLLYEFYDLKKEGRNDDALVVDEKLKKMSADFYLGRQAP